MDLNEAVRLLAETTVIVPGSRLDEARRTVLTRLRHLEGVAWRAQAAALPDTPEDEATARYILDGTR